MSISIVVSYAENLKQWIIQPMIDGKYASTIITETRPSDYELREMFGNDVRIEYK